MSRLSQAFAADRRFAAGFASSTISIQASRDREAGGKFVPLQVPRIPEKPWNSWIYDNVFSSQHDSATSTVSSADLIKDIKSYCGLAEDAIVSVKAESVQVWNICQGDNSFGLRVYSPVSGQVLSDHRGERSIMDSARTGYAFPQWEAGWSMRRDCPLVEAYDLNEGASCRIVMVVSWQSGPA